jgi:hypothetical protein
MWFFGIHYHIRRPDDEPWRVTVTWEWTPDYVVPTLIFAEFSDIVADMDRLCRVQHRINSATVPTELHFSDDMVG